MAPILVDDPFLALGMTVNFPPWKPFFDFLFRSYSCFRKKNWLTAQKVFPPPTVGVPSASKSPSALSAQALRAPALRARAWQIVWKQCRDIHNMPTFHKYTNSKYKAGICFSGSWNIDDPYIGPSVNDMDNLVGYTNSMQTLSLFYGVYYSAQIVLMQGHVKQIADIATMPERLTHSREMQNTQ